MRYETLAVLGGGQLGRMLGLAAAPLAVPCKFLDPKDDACAGDVGELVVADLDDEAGLRRVAAGASVVTYEWEGVPAESAELLARELPVRPGASSLRASQDRAVEKDLFGALNIPTARFRRISERSDLDSAIEELGLPAVLKTRSGGYDGKGQAVLRDADDTEVAWARLGDAQLVVEQWIPFRRELSVFATRSASGAIAVWDVTENTHDNGILSVSRAPARDLDAVTVKQATQIVTRLADHLDHVGTLAVELFDTGDDLLANEFAPRVHNSGHWTIDASETSQFENHVRAALDLPLGDPSRIDGVAAMVNCLGAMPDHSDVLSIPGAHLHDYNKRPAPGRKVGHVTIVCPEPEQLESRIDAVLALTRAASASVETA